MAVRVLQVSRWPWGLRMVVPAVVLPSLVTGAAALPFRPSTAMAALGFVLAVTIAALIGGSGAGLLASVLSFLALNFFFTPPVGTFSVGKTEDLVALVVFLFVSAVVGALVSRMNAQRHRAERREREARLLQHLGTRLISGETPEKVLESFGRALLDLTPIARYEAQMGSDGSVAPALGETSDVGMGREDFPVVVGDHRVGVIRTFIPTSGPRLAEGERHLIRTFVAQLGLALEGARLATLAQEAQVDAERSRLEAALLQSVTHDLRTPLASITAATSSLLDPEANLGQADRADLLETVLQEAARLDRLVVNLLDLTRLRAGALTPSKRTTALDEVIEAVLSRLGPLLQDHALNVVLRDDLPEIPIDVVQMDQAITNILENAAKYSPPRSQINISAARWENTVQVRIADQGTGIDPALRAQVFEPFFRGDGTVTGSGLGLAIAHAVVVAHGGTIWIEDAPGGGTAVVFRLPIDEPS
jgi:two-component system, OmpR family, sensor histidine kinase KdpD